MAVPRGERCSCDEVIDAGVVARSALLNAGDAAEGALGHQNRCGAVLVTADNVRLGEAVLEMTVQYASCGSKSGAPSAASRRVKHKCATMRMWPLLSLVKNHYGPTRAA